MAEEETTADGNDSGLVPVFEEDIHQVNISEEMEQAYLNYSMSVLIGRALPDARDGFKPVHRRCLYAMWRLGNRHDAPYKKSARIVGDVIGKYHPHGDASVYDTIVRMAQPFSLRYTLVDGHGNFGTIDRDPAAAMRYTEVRLSRIAEDMLTDIDRDTVDMMPNFDGTELEPSVLPARYPQLLVNGSQGIAVGMATSMPTHNLSDTIDACLHALSHPNCGIDELIQIIKAPDFPTGGTVFGIAGVCEAYRTGRGSILLRAKIHEEEDKKGRTSIVIDEIPYMVNKADLVKKIASLKTEGKLGGIADIRDESSSKIRVVIDLKRDAHVQTIENNLFKLTELQTSFGINMVAILDGRPQQLNLKQLIEAFLGLRREIVIRRTRFLLKKARADGHLQEGLAIALANIDEFIEIIKNSSDRSEAAERLMSRGWKAEVAAAMVRAAEGNYQDYRPEAVEPPDCGFGADGLYRLSRVQTERILDMRLQTLTSTQQESIVKAYRETCAQIRDYLDILRRDERVVKIIADDLLLIKQTYGDARKSEIDYAGDPDFDEVDLVEQREIVITLSRDGYIKRRLLSDYQTQKKGGKGKKSGKLGGDDTGNLIAVASTRDHVLLLTNRGRGVVIKHAFEIPEGTGASRGRPVQNFVSLAEEETVDEKGAAVKVLESITNILTVPTPDADRCAFFFAARSPVRSQQQRLNRNEVAIGELPLDDRAAIKSVVAAERAELSKMTDEAWNSFGLTYFPEDMRSKLKTLTAPSGDGKSKAWSELSVSDLPEEGRAAARAKYADKLESLCSMPAPDFAEVLIGNLPVKARAKAREAFRLTLLSDFAKTHCLFLATKNGIVKKMSLADLAGLQKTGKSLIQLNPGDTVAGASETDGRQAIMLISDSGRAANFLEKRIRTMGLVARGVRGMKLLDGSKVVSMIVYSKEEKKKLLLATNRGIGKRTSLSEFTLHSRNTQGVVAIKCDEGAKVVGSCLVGDDDEVVLLTRTGMLSRIRASEIRLTGRNALGVKLINLNEGDELVSIEAIEASPEEGAAAPESTAGAVGEGDAAERFREEEALGSEEPEADDQNS